MVKCMIILEDRITAWISATKQHRSIVNNVEGVQTLVGIGEVIVDIISSVQKGHKPYSTLVSRNIPCQSIEGFSSIIVDISHIGQSDIIVFQGILVGQIDNGLARVVNPHAIENCTKMSIAARMGNKEIISHVTSIENQRVSFRSIGRHYGRIAYYVGRLG